MKKINEMLNEEIAKEIKNLENLTPGSEEHQKAVESLAKLYELSMQEDTNKSEKVKAGGEYFLKFVQIGVEIAGVVLPLMVYSTWMDRGFKFEETGTYTSTTFKSLFQKFKATK